MKEINNAQDFIDSRDIIERVEELEGFENVDLDDDEKEELQALQELVGECEGYSGDWQYGATLIRDSYFEQYARDFAEDIGAVDRSTSWPNDCIDWKEAAEQLQMDYTCVDFDGVDYWIR